MERDRSFRVYYRGELIAVLQRRLYTQVPNGGGLPGDLERDLIAAIAIHSLGQMEMLQNITRDLGKDLGLEESRNQETLKRLRGY